MNHLTRGLVVLASCVGLWTSALWAEEKPQAEAFPLADMKADLPRFVDIIEAFGNGNLDTGLDLIEAELPRPFPPANGAFQEDVRGRWREEFGRLTELNAKFESVDFVGYQPVSSASRSLVLIGHGELGPILFRFRVFRYQDKWKVNGLKYEGSWDGIEVDNNFTRFQTPFTYPLATQPVAQTDEE